MVVLFLSGRRFYRLPSLWLSVFVIAALTIFGYVITGQKTPTNDVFWHLAMGRSMVENYVFPLVDDYSFTWRGRELGAFPYLFELVLYQLVKIFGYDSGTHVYLFSCFMATAGAVLLFTRLAKAGQWLTIMAITAVPVVLSFRLLVRPEFFSYCLIVLAFCVYVRARESLTLRVYICALVLMIFWSNYHSAILGYIIFFGLYVDLLYKNVIEKAATRQWIAWFSGGVCLVLAGFANPFFEHAVLTMILSDQRWYDLIQEYLNIFHTVGAAWIVVPFVVVCVGAILLSVKCRRPGYITILLVMGSSAITMNRMSTAFFLMAVLILVELMVVAKKENMLANPVAHASNLFVPLLIVVWTAYSIYLFVTYRPVTDFKPHAMIQFIKDQKLKGNVVNDYGLGGFLIYHLYPHSRVYIDGRAGIFYDVPFYMEYSEMLRNPEILRDSINKNHVTMMIVESGYDLNEVVYHTGEMSLEYVDSHYSLYVLGDGNFKYSGFLRFNPSCWAKDSGNQLRSEVVVANEMHGLDTNFKDFLQSMMAYAEAQDKTKYFQSVLDRSSSNSTIRFMAYQALSLGDLEHAKIFFSSLVQYQSKDYLAASYALLLEGDYPGAEKVLSDALSAKDKYVDNQDRLFALLLMKALQEKIDLELISPETIVGLQDHLSQSGVEWSRVSLSYDLLCGADRPAQSGSIVGY